jgi:hypothetical protein
MHASASPTSLETSEISQIKLEKIQVFPNSSGYCAEFLDSLNAHANYRYVLFGAESKKPEIMVNQVKSRFGC